MLGIAGNALVLAVYLASRTTGLPIGPDINHPEPVGGLDVVSGILELALIAGCAALLWRPALVDRPVRRRGGFAAVAALLVVPALVIEATTAVMTPGWAGPEGPAGMASASSGSAGAAGSSGSAGSAGMPGMGSTSGLPDMRMYGTIAPPTATQAIAAGELIRATDAGLVRYQNVQAALAAGYTRVLRTNGEEHLLARASGSSYPAVGD